MKYRPCRCSGKKHIVPIGQPGQRPYHWWSPADWVRDIVDWWKVSDA